MANKPLQTIKFPGLTDTYTVPQVDSNFVGTAGQVPDSKKVHDEIDSLKEELNIESVVNNHQVYVPCDDGTLGATYTVFSKSGRVLTMTNGAPASTLTRVCIYGVFDYKAKAPSYNNVPTWYNDPLDSFVVGHRYKFDYKLISGTIDRGEITNDFYFDLRTRDGTSQIISGMPNEWTCTFQPEMIAFGVYQFSFNNTVIYLSITDLTEAESDDPTLDRIEALEEEVSNLYNIVNCDVSTLGTWETGYYSAEGEKGTSSHFIRTVGRIDVSDAVQVRIEPPTGYAVSACAISEDGIVTSYGNANSTNHTENINVPVTFGSKPYESMLITCGRFADSSAAEKAVDTEFCGTIKVYLYKVSGTEKGSDRYDYPSFFDEQLATSITKINIDINSNKTVGTYGTDIEFFAFITDVHWAENKKHSPGLIKQILDNTPVQTVICGGDFIHSSNATKAGAAKEIREFNTLITGIPCYEYFCVFGNHDDNSNGGSSIDVQFTKTEQYNLMYAPFADKSNVHWIWEDVPSILNEPVIKNDYYVDHPRTKTRYLCIDWNNPINSTRSTWIQSVLAKDDGFRVIVIYHGIYSGSGGVLTPEHTTIMTAIEPYKSKVVALFTGHAHMDAVEDYYGDGSVPVILTSCDTFKAERMTEGTLDEQCFDVAVIDYGQSKIKLTRIGRGTDREIAISLA